MTTAPGTKRRGAAAKSVKQLDRLPGLLAKRREVASRLRGWDAETPLWFEGVWGPIRGIAAAMLAGRSPSLLVVVPHAADPDPVCDDLGTFGVADALALPIAADTDTPESIRDQDFAQRLQIARRLLSGPTEPGAAPRVVVASVGAAMQPMPTPGALASSSRALAVGDAIEVEPLLRWLAASGYHAATAVELPGEFSQRGGILDVFSPDHPRPVRIELFGDDIESLRRFDPASQRSTESIERVELATVSGGETGEGLITEFLPPGAGVLVVEPNECRQAADAMLARVARPERFAGWEGVIRAVGGRPLALATQLAEAGTDAVVDLRTASVEAFVGDLDHLRRRVDEVGASGPVVVVGDTPADAERMTELMEPTAAARSGRLRIVTGALSGGFRLLDPEVLVLTGAELFHRSPVRRVRAPKARGKAIDSFLDLKPGDLVVHLAHGIGLYRGLELIEKHGQKQEHLAIEFDGGTKIFVPASKIGLVQRYVGGTKSRPRLAKIGSQSWVRQKKAAAAAVTDMASELLEMQAQRSARAGIAFSPDTDWQRQFDASFPYTETADQLTAIHAVKDDMESPQPMDRLICGDVGFGKTEVAMRAAFKAVASGYQVAVLVPTTVLAEQHFKTFRDRMAEFPFDIVKLSRFSSGAEQRETLRRLRGGQVDIVIGTHRLASKDVRFYNLGLVIIDEEQRFGVQVKERLKTRHSNVDVLTLSATPIPRTLHMSLVGVRDISNLETAPEERLAVETKVTRWDDALIRSAVVRELNREGQIYFVHNRIGDIDAIRNRLKQIAGEATIGIGHGQMPEGELEKVMVRFIDGGYDLLLATTIIESGLDIPNANTMFVDEADRYGLADLHQLRGRVGRYKHQAYCYLLVDPHKHLTPNAAKRLRAIEEYSQMGAGFAIAMRDLEIRGAGNLLGTQQSGHIAAVGYELYCQLLEDAVRNLRHLPPRRSADVEIDLPVAAFLPTDYVPDMRQKIDLYRRLNRADDIGDLAELKKELEDRFGPLPRVVARMLELAELRIDAAVWQIRGVTQQEGKYLVLTYGDPRRIEQLKRTTRRPVRIVDQRQAYVPVEIPEEGEGEAWLEVARSLLQPA